MKDRPAISCAIRHAFGWLFFANLIGVVMALLLVFPQAGNFLGGFTYGRWVPLHLNWQLYGWTSLPLIAWLFSIYEVDRYSKTSAWAKVAVAGWSLALACGGLSWLMGHSSGKIFLDWKGAALWVFLAAQVGLWISLARALRKNTGEWTSWARLLRGLALAFLAMVPFSLWLTTSPQTYPPINPSTGGPTGASLLGSTLTVVALLLLLPRTLRLTGTPRSGRWYVALWVFEFVAFILLEWRGGTHRQIEQILGLALLIPWVWLIPRCLLDFTWPKETVFWRRSALLWWGALVLLGWAEFLPGILDRMKFTNGLVAHSHLAMAGFTSSYVLLLSVALGGRKMGELLRRGSMLWQGSVIVYVMAMIACGWLEGAEYSWMSEMPLWRTALYVVRLLCGLVMLGVSWQWWWGNIYGRKLDEA